MNAEYRMVHFIVDAATERRVPLGALVRQGEIVTFIGANPPSTRCVGDAKAVSVFHLAHHYLARPEWVRVPRPISANVVFGAENEVPVHEGDDAEAWVRTVLLKRLERRPTERRKRSTLGREALLQAIKGRAEPDWVQRRFRPEQGGPWLRRERLLTPVTHWVGPASTRAGEVLVEGAPLLLLEPLVLTHPTFEADLHVVASTFAMYRAARDAAGVSADRLTLAAYFVTPKDHRTDVAHRMKEVERYGADVAIDLQVDTQVSFISERISCVAAWLPAAEAK